MSHEHELDKARHGDPEALARLLEDFRPRIYSIGRQRLIEKNRAEELYNEVYLRLIRYMPGFTGKNLPGFYAYVRRTVLTVCNEWNRYFPTEGLISMDTSGESGESPPEVPDAELGNE
jgi:DNA-directed RNA polymerase specialized sigma24 family protein